MKINGIHGDRFDSLIYTLGIISVFHAVYACSGGSFITYGIICI